MKRCKRCREKQEITEFHKHPTTKDGYHSFCKTCRKKYMKKLYARTCEEIKRKSNEYYQKNKEKLRPKRRAYQKERLANDPAFALARRLRNRLWYALDNKGWKKNTSFNEYIGCNYDELISHIESQFQEGMSWENKDKWDIDHIVPLSSAIDLKDMLRLCHYTNLQPMWSRDNRIKYNRIESNNEE